MATSTYSSRHPLVSSIASAHDQLLTQRIKPSPDQVTKGPALFTVSRQDPELIRPSKPTPQGIKPLSDIDDQQSYHFQVPIIQFYPKGSTNKRHPAIIIKAALAKALEWYYPLAGRVREVGPNKKLVVDCNSEGMLFIQAEADITLDELIAADLLKPPFPCCDELLYDVPGMSGILDSPVILVQVTHLKCGGFVSALRFNHVMCDATGIVQFMNAVAEIARGQSSPSVTPIWDRHLLDARVPPRVTCTHRQYDEVDGTDLPFDDVVQRSFFFGPDQISALRRWIPSDLQCTRFELVSACLWRCRTIAIQLDPHQEARFVCAVNARSKYNPPIPSGYYGNAFALSGTVSSTENLVKNPLSYAVHLIKKVKADVTEEYMKSVADLMVLTGRRHISMIRSHVISDLSRVGFHDVDYGWGKPVYGGPAKAGAGGNPVLLSYFAAYKTCDGHNGILYPIYLPAPAMERFQEELRKMLT